MNRRVAAVPGHAQPPLGRPLHTLLPENRLRLHHEETFCSLASKIKRRELWPSLEEKRTQWNGEGLRPRALSTGAAGGPPLARPSRSRGISAQRAWGWASLSQETEKLGGSQHPQAGSGAEAHGMSWREWEAAGPVSV